MPENSPQSVDDVFGEHVKSARRRRGLTQSALAERLTGLGRKTAGRSIARIEKAQVSVTLEDAVKIALAVDSPLVEMLDSPDPVAVGPYEITHLRDRLEGKLRWVELDQHSAAVFAARAETWAKLIREGVDVEDAAQQAGLRGVWPFAEALPSDQIDIEGEDE